MEREILFDRHEFPNLLNFFLQSMLGPESHPILEFFNKNIVLIIYEKSNGITRDSFRNICVYANRQWLQDNLKDEALVEYFY